MSGTPTSDVLAAEQARTTAMVARDFDVLERLLDDECTYIHSSGAVDSKRSYLDKLAQRAFEYRSISTSEHQVLDLGNGYAVPHRMDASLVLAGVERPYQSRVISLWRSGAIGLRLVYLQATAIPDTPS